jgi:hypothetical protein
MFQSPSTLVLDEKDFMKRITAAAGSIPRAVVCIRLIKKAQKQFDDMTSLCRTIKGMKKKLSVQFAPKDEDEAQKKERAQGQYDVSIQRMVQRRILNRTYFDQVSKKESSAEILARRNADPLDEILGMTSAPTDDAAQGASTYRKDHPDPTDQNLTAFDLTRPRGERYIPKPCVIPPVYKTSNNLNAYMKYSPKTSDDALVMALEDTRTRAKELDEKEIAIGASPHPLLSIATSFRANQALAARPKRTDGGVSLPNIKRPSSSRLKPPVLTDVWWDSTPRDVPGSADGSRRGSVTSDGGYGRRRSMSLARSAPLLMNSMRPGENDDRRLAKRVNTLDNMSLSSPTRLIPYYQTFKKSPQKPREPRHAATAKALTNLRFGLGAANAPLLVPAGVLIPDETDEPPRTPVKRSPRAKSRSGKSKGGKKEKKTSSGKLDDTNQLELRNMAYQGLQEDKVDLSERLLLPPPGLLHTTAIDRSMLPDISQRLEKEGTEKVVLQSSLRPSAPTNEEYYMVPPESLSEQIEQPRVAARPDGPQGQYRSMDIPKQDKIRDQFQEDWEQMLELGLSRMSRGDIHPRDEEHTKLDDHAMQQKVRQVLWTQYPRLLRAYRWLAVDDPAYLVKLQQQRNAKMKAKSKARKKAEGKKKKNSAAANDPTSKEFYRVLVSKLPWEHTPEADQARTRIFHEWNISEGGKKSVGDPLTYMEAEGGAIRLLNLSNMDPTKFDPKPVIKRAFKAACGSGERESIVESEAFTHSLEIDEFQTFIYFLKLYFELYLLFKTIDDSGDMRINLEVFAP